MSYGFMWPGEARPPSMVAPGGARDPVYPSQAQRGDEGLLRTDGCVRCRESGAVLEDWICPDREGDGDNHRGVRGPSVNEFLRFGSHPRHCRLCRGDM